MLLSLSAVTVKKPTDLEYPVVGTSLAPTCDNDISDASTYQWYKGATKDSETGKTLTITGATANDGDYKCVVLDSNSKKSAESPVTNVAFKSKYLLIVGEDGDQYHVNRADCAKSLIFPH